MADFEYEIGTRVFVVEDVMKRGREGCGVITDKRRWHVGIRLDDGREIHGYESWWVPEEWAKRDGLCNCSSGQPRPTPATYEEEQV